MVFSQGDVTALAMFRGSASAGQYTPTMRMLEALTALGIGVKFADTRQMFLNPQSGLRSRVMVPLICVYLAGAAFCFLAAPTILAFAFGDAYAFNYSVALLLAPAYFCSSIITNVLQILIARGCGHTVALWTTGVIVLAVLLLGVGAARIGAVGVALADLLVLAAWLAILLRLEKVSRSLGVNS
jgi:O-antigen/teichoic acid export membrane protein